MDFGTRQEQAVSRARLTWYGWLLGTRLDPKAYFHHRDRTEAASFLAEKTVALGANLSNITPFGHAL